jgi:hypothetical protein
MGSAAQKDSEERRLKDLRCNVSDKSSERKTLKSR